MLSDRILHLLRRASSGGITRGELAILLIDADDDAVTAALEEEVDAGRVTTSFHNGLLRYHPNEGEG